MEKRKGNLKKAHSLERLEEITHIYIKNTSKSKVSRRAVQQSCPTSLGLAFVRNLSTIPLLRIARAFPYLHLMLEMVKDHIEAVL